MSSIGVAIITYKRPGELKRCLNSVFSYPTHGAEIVVFDDCSLDDTVNVGSDYTKVISSSYNSGVIGNKNRALYYFTEVSKKDVIILLEDDVFVKASNWLDLWCTAAETYGHMNFSAPWFKDESLSANYVSGNGSVETPDVYREMVTGQCTSFLRTKIKNEIGYLNPLFKGYGHGHVEWTNRFVRNGLGGFTDNGRMHYYCISGEIEAPYTPSFKNDQELELNLVVLRDLISKKEDHFIEYPWLNDVSKIEFLKCFA